MSDKEDLKQSKKQLIDSGQWTGDPEPIKPPRSLNKQEAKLLLAMITDFFLDFAWMLLLKIHSPKIASPESGRVVMLQIKSRIYRGVEFYVRPFEAYVHYVLLTIFSASLVVLLFRGLNTFFRKQG